MQVTQTNPSGFGKCNPAVFVQHSNFLRILTYQRKAPKAAAAARTPPTKPPMATARAMKPANQKIIVTAQRARVAKGWVR